MPGTGSFVLTGGFELGGTKCIALIARGPVVVDSLTVPTSEPGVVLDTLTAWLAAAPPLAAIGIASFGPLGLDRRRADFGHITTTTKPGWSNIDVLGAVKARFALPVGFDTDVAGAALAEGRWGASQGCGVHVYLTIGTGIGGGVVVDGRAVHGLMHPEIGHVRVRRVPGDSFAGSCPFHGDCLEGLAAGPAIAARIGADPPTLTADAPVWQLVAAELAELMTTLIMTLSPERIVIGGGVGYGQPQLLPLIRAATGKLLASYVPALDAAGLERLIRPPGLGAQAGSLGAIAVALDALASAG
jgi:fructokinase